MIHILDKGTLRNQYPVRRKTKNKRASLSSKRVLKQDTPEKKLRDSWLKKSHFSLIAIIAFSFTYYLSPLLPLSSVVHRRQGEGQHLISFCCPEPPCWNIVI